MVSLGGGRVRGRKAVSDKLKCDLNGIGICMGNWIIPNFIPDRGSLMIVHNCPLLPDLSDCNSLLFTAVACAGVDITLYSGMETVLYSRYAAFKK